MKSLAIAALIAFGFASVAAAQTTKPAPAPSAGDAKAEARFKSADKNGNGSLEGAELNTYKAAMTRIDTDKDNKVSRAEFVAAMKSGYIK